MTELLVPCTIACDAVPDPAVFWAMVGALGTAVAALGALATALVAIVGIPFLYYQLVQIRAQSAVHYADGIKWLVDYFMSEDRRFNNLTNGFSTAIQNSDVPQIRRDLSLILADADLARRLKMRDYLTDDMLYATAGISLARVVEDVEPLLDAPNTREVILDVIKYRPEAYDLMLAMKVIYDREIERAEAWREGQDGDE